MIMNSFLPGNSELADADEERRGNFPGPGKNLPKLNNKKTVRFHDDLSPAQGKAPSFDTSKKPQSEVPTATGDSEGSNVGPDNPFALAIFPQRPSRPSLSVVPTDLRNDREQRIHSSSVLKFTNQSPRKAARARAASWVTTGRPRTGGTATLSRTHSGSESTSSGGCCSVLTCKISRESVKELESGAPASASRNRSSSSGRRGSESTLQPPENEDGTSSGESTPSSGFSAVTSGGGLGAPVLEHMIRRDPKTGHRYITSSFAGLDL